MYTNLEQSKPQYFQQNQSMPFQLCICQMTDQKLLANFPNDPYADVLIQTANRKLHLSLAYLAIDSAFFAALPPNTPQVSLQHLQQQPLILVLRSLYGGSLEVFSVSELESVLAIIDALELSEYKQKIVKSIRTKHQKRTELQGSILDSIELIDFCLKNDLIKQQICQYHFRNKLCVLQNTKNYLQLSKLSEQSLNYILTEYHQSDGDDNVINHILENYFNRKSIRPVQYFQNENVSTLREIWQKFHHKVALKIPTLERTEQSMIQIVPPPKNGKITSLSTLGALKREGGDLFKSQTISEGALLDLRIQNLTKELDQKSRKVVCLQLQLKQLLSLKQKKQLQLKKKAQQSLNEISLLKNMKKIKKSKEEMLSHLSDKSTNLNELAFQNYKKAEPQKQGRQVKLKLVSKPNIGKRIFN